MEHRLGHVVKLKNSTWELYREPINLSREHKWPQFKTDLTLKVFTTGLGNVPSMKMASCTSIISERMYWGSRFGRARNATPGKASLSVKPNQCREVTIYHFRCTTNGTS